MKIGWWDFGWYSSDSKHSVGTRRVLEKLNRYHDVRLLGLPRKPTGTPEDYEFRSMRSENSLDNEQKLKAEIRKIIKQNVGFDVAYRCRQPIEDALATGQFAFEPCDVYVVRVGPAGFLEPKLIYAAAVVRAISAGPTAVLDEDAGIQWLPEFAETERVHLWAPYLKQIEGFARQQFLVWPYDSKEELPALLSPPNLEFDLGYVGNHWAANGPNRPHVERLFEPKGGQRYAVWGEWPPEDRLHRVGLEYRPPIEPRIVRQTYHRWCLATVLMAHGRAGCPHVTPRVNEAIEAGVPLLYDAKIVALKDVLPSGFFVKNAVELSEVLTEFREQPERRLRYVQEQRQTRPLVPGGKLEDWIAALEELKRCV